MDQTPSVIGSILVTGIRAFIIGRSVETICKCLIGVIGERIVGEKMSRGRR